MILVCLLFLFLPSQFGLHFWPGFSQISGIYIDYLSPTLLITDILIIPLIFLYFIHLKNFLKLNKTFFIFVSLAIINIIFSLNSLNSLFKYLRLLEYSFLVLYFVSRPRYLYAALENIFPLSIILISSLAWVQFYLQRSVNGIWYFWGERALDLSTPQVAKINLPFLGQFLRPYSSFSHPNSFAGFLIVSALILYYFYRKTPNKILFTSILISLLTIPLTFSRTVIFLEAIVLIMILQKSRLVSLSLSPVIFLLLFTGNPGSILERVQQIKLAWQFVVLKPLVGVGLGNFSIVNSTFQPVHNLILLLITEIGFPLFLLLISVLVKKIKSFSLLPLTLKLAWFCIVFTGMVDHYWITLPQNLLLIFILLSLTINIRTESS